MSECQTVRPSQAPRGEVLVDEEAMKTKQSQIESLTARVIRLDPQLELLTRAAMIKKLREK